MSDVKKVVLALSTLAKVEQSLRFLASVNIVREEMIVKGCKKFVADHPEINEYINGETK